MPTVVRECVHCESKLKVAESQLGRIVECPKCGKPTRLPLSENPLPIQVVEEPAPPKIQTNKKLKPCPACGHLVGKAVQKCPQCGSSTITPKEIAVGLVAFIGVSFFTWILLCGGFGNSDSFPKPEEETRVVDLESQAKHAAMQSVKILLAEVLKAPSTAEYPMSTIRVKWASPIDGAATYVVTGAVDSQNSFGAMIRGQWRVTEMLREGNWYPMYVSLDDRMIFGEEEFKR